MSREIVHRTPQIAAKLHNADLAAQLREIAGQLGSLLTQALAEQRPLSASEMQRIHLTKGRIVQLERQLRVNAGYLAVQDDLATLRDLQGAYAVMHRDYLERGLDYHRTWLCCRFV